MFQAWKLWKEDKPLDLIDTCLEDSCILLEIVRCLRISFLCLQQHPEDRPNMSSVVMMLRGESSLLEPKEPTYFVGKKLPSSRKNQSSSTNEITITLLEARQPNAHINFFFFFGKHINFIIAYLIINISIVHFLS